MAHARGRPTVKDVAAAAGVGVMTVSYTFNKPERVADATRARVLAAARSLGYHRPDSVARALRSGRTGQLGVVFGEHLSYAFDDAQAGAFLAGVADVCVEGDLGMMLIPTRGDAADADRVLAAGVDGYVLWTTTDDDPVLEAVARSGRPAAIQGGPAAPGIMRVGPDDLAAAREVAAAGIASGDYPVVISFPLDRQREWRQATVGAIPDPVGFAVTRGRLRGFREALAAAGHDWAATPVVVTQRNQRHQGKKAMRSLLRAIPRGASPVVLAMSDELALGAREALLAARRSATITGWDASAEGMAAGIISVTNPLRDQGRICARAALDPDTTWEPIRWRLSEPGALD